jgi:YebC/PmpR family DNA-binding regulatory protein
MAGHSKWANIQHRKGAQDKKRAKIFTRIGKEITIAAREGGKDPDSNPRLRLALTQAKSANMPKDNIARAVKKGTGELEGGNLEELVYEGYGPAGVAILVECLTDNKNRSASEVRMTFDRNNGNLAGSGAVAWMFHRKGHFLITGENADEDKLMDIVLDAGAEDIEVDGETAEIWTPVDAFSAVATALEEAGIAPEEASVVMQPENLSEIKDVDTATKALKLLDKLEDLDDVQNVTSNIDIPDEIMEQIQL